MKAEPIPVADATVFSHPAEPHNTFLCYWHHGNLIFQTQPSIFGWAEVHTSPEKRIDGHPPGAFVWTGIFQIVGLSLNRIHAAVATGTITLNSGDMQFAAEITVRNQP